MEKAFIDNYAPITPEELARIPEEMKQEPRWICWGSEKVPVSVANALDGTHYGINVTDAANWGTFEQAVSKIGDVCSVKSVEENFHIVGVGFVVGDGWFCVDLDGGKKHQGKEDVPEHAITDALQTMQTYAEKSLSGCGYHVFGKCDFSTTDAERNEPHRGQDGNPVPGSYEVEFFTRRKFIAITGRIVDGSTGNAIDCSAAALDFYNRYILSDWKKDEKKRQAERAKIAANVPVNIGDAEQMFLLNYPEILAASDSSNFKRGGRGVKLGSGEYSWIGAIKAMQEIKIPESAILDWCRRGSNFKSDRDVINVLNKASKSGTRATVAGIIADAKAHGWKPDPEKLTGTPKANHEARLQREKEEKRIEEEYRKAHRKEHIKALSAVGIETDTPERYTWTYGFDGSISQVIEIESGEIVYSNPATGADPGQTTETIEGITIHDANPDASAPAAEKPGWLKVKVWQGREILEIDEPTFARMFQDEYKVHRINGVFYMNGEPVQDDYILMLIQQKVAAYFTKNTGRLTNNVFITLSNSVFTKQPEPDETKIFCKNGITILVKKDGTFEPVQEEIFTLTRIGANYNPNATCPTFNKYLNELFYADDIPAIQEYIGYCLIPCTRAQAGLFVKGKGGEGKSVLRDVTMALFGHAAIQEYIHQLGERFTIANLENRLVVVDDDLQSDLLKETSTLKKLITARERFQVERKLKTKYDAFLFSRIIAIGNTFIGSKFDHSDGFYRRQLLVDVMPKTRDEIDDDRFMSDKCVAEIDGILNWALEGLSRLIKNNYHFTISDRMERTLDGIKHDGDNTLTFIEDDIYIEITKDRDDKATTADLFTLYAKWCSDNGDTPIKRKSFQMRMSERFKDYKTRIRTVQGSLQGFAGIKLTLQAEETLSRLSEKQLEWIRRLP